MALHPPEDSDREKGGREGGPCNVVLGGNKARSKGERGRPGGKVG